MRVLKVPRLDETFQFFFKCILKLKSLNVVQFFFVATSPPDQSSPDDTAPIPPDQPTSSQILANLPSPGQLPNSFTTPQCPTVPLRNV